MAVAGAHGTENIVLLLVGNHDPTNVSDGHQNCAAHVTGLPFHPVVLTGVEDIVALADLLVCIRVRPKEVLLRRFGFPKVAVKLHVPVFVCKRGPQPVAVASVTREFFRNSYSRLSAWREFRNALDVRAVLREVCVQVKVIGVALDEARQIFGRNGKANLSPRPQEASNRVLAFAVQLVRLVMRSPRRSGRSCRGRTARGVLGKV